MTIPDRRARVLEAFARAPDHQLPPEILAIPTLGAAPRRRLALLNLLCRWPGCRYLEFGSFMGQSLLAAAFDNVGQFRGVENFSQFTAVPAREALRKNLARAPELGCPVLAPASVLEIDWREFRDGPIDVFFYDAEHDQRATADALVHIAPMLELPAVLVVDDWELPSWAGHVQAGVYEGRARAGLRIAEEWELPRADRWHEGVYVAIVSEIRR